MNRLLVVFVLLLVAVASPFAAADTINLNFGSFGVVGTVTLTQNGSNVDVTFTAASGFAFKTSGGDILFSANGVTTGVLAGSFSESVNGTTYNNVSFSFGGPGSFTRAGQTYAYDISKLGPKGIQSVTSISFTLTGVTVADLENSLIGIHVCVLNGGDASKCGAVTGFANTGHQGTVPEPGTLSLLGTGLVGLAGAFRRRFLA